MGHDVPSWDTPVIGGRARGFSGGRRSAGGGQPSKASAAAFAASIFAGVVASLDHTGQANGVVWKRDTRLTVR